MGSVTIASITLASIAYLIILRFFAQAILRHIRVLRHTLTYRDPLDPRSCDLLPTNSEHGETPVQL